MTDGYTPSTDEIRFRVEYDWEPSYGDGSFDRWLAQHEAAIRRDQIEKDAAIADAFDWQSWSEPNQVIVAAIRAQSQSPREMTDDGPWEYGRRERSSGMVRPLRGVPLPDWWGESQAEWEHVRARSREWEPVPATTEGEH